MATAYLRRGSRRETVMNDVVRLQIQEGGVIVKGLFGEQKCIEAQIREVNFMNSTITLEDMDVEEVR